MIDSPVPLDMLGPDDQGVIVEMCGNPMHVKRLQEVGIRVGCCVRMVCQGSPCMVCIEGRRLSLRLDQEAEIYVTPQLSMVS